MAVRLLKDVLREKWDRLSTLEFPETVKVTYCKTVTNSKIVRTPHGIVRVEHRAKL